jgi:DNA-binding response OmpR family regulator/HPt (histidine-containing phosphotransfer) domain-containing protein
MRILLVEDDRHTQDLLKTSLVQENFLVDEAEDGETAWELLQQFSYDLVLLDVMLPRLDGISLCKRLRQTQNPIPVLLLTTRSSVSDKLLGLESGADDYVTKPFHLEELVARIRTVARRNPTTVNSVLTCDRLCLDPTSRQVTYDGQDLKMGRKEYLILELLLRHPHNVFNRSDFIDRLWSLDQDLPTEATVKSHIRRIRRKLEEVGAADLIETLYGQGYRLNPALVEASEYPSATVQPLSEASVKQVHELTAQVWQRAYGKSLEKIGELEQAIANLRADELDEATREQAVFMAHKLAGSLHIFGFELAAQWLQAIEDTFRQPTVSPAIAPQLQQWLALVRLDLAGQPGAIAPIHLPSPITA